MLAPVSRMAPADGVAMTDEVLAVVSQRRGQVRALTAATSQSACCPSDRLFHDPHRFYLHRRSSSPTFSKTYRSSRCPSETCVRSSRPHHICADHPTTLFPRRVDGAPNFRKADAAVTASRDGALSSRKVYGTGMPSSDGLRQALDKMGAGKDGKKVVYWTSLRE